MMATKTKKYPKKVYVQFDCSTNEDRTMQVSEDPKIVRHLNEIIGVYEFKELVKIEMVPKITMEHISKKVKTAIEEYQCPGCVCGSDTKCYEKGESEACWRHVAGTLISGIGKVFLGMPKGFNHLGACKDTKISIFKEFRDGWGYDYFNVPIWKYKDKYENVIVRGMSPRINFPWIHIFLIDCMQEINCAEITENQLAEMD
jgi:hypothetical protein